MSEIKLHQRLTLEIEKSAFEGKSIARKDGYVIFVMGAVPGDTAEVEIVKKKKNYSIAKVNNIIKKSESRTEPECKYFGVCGGCNWQNLSYQKQLEYKRDQIIDVFTKIARIEQIMVLATLPSPKIYRYRNKVEFSFGSSRWLTINEIQSNAEIKNKNFALGFHIPERYDKVLNIDSCLLQSEVGDKILNTIYHKALEYGCKSYNSRDDSGFLKNLVIRTSLNGGLIVNLITASVRERNEINFLNWYMESFTKMYNGDTTIVHSINNSSSPVAFREIVFSYGAGYITEKICDLIFKISPYSFFQTNSYQLNNFIDKIIDLSQLSEDLIVWDFYCGVGSITLPISQRVSKVYGFELSSSAIEDANINARINNIKNVEFHKIDLNSKRLSSYLNEFPRPDILILDPPRSGLHKNTINTILQILPEEIIYVSCNPATQARDCSLLLENYNIDLIRPIDMFPHTYHIESLALLTRKND